MKLSKYLKIETIKILPPINKAEALDILVDALVNAGVGPGHIELLKAINEREELMSTGIGIGIAVPHVRLKSIPHPMIGIGICRDGIKDYESIDNSPVQIVVMIAAPAGEHETYIRLLASVSDILKHNDLRSPILDSKDPENAYDILVKGSI